MSNQNTDKKNSDQMSKAKFDLHKLVDGQVLVSEQATRLLPFILFLVVLAFIYIGNRYNAESLVRRIDAAKKELKELRSESVATASVLMMKSKQTSVVEEVARRDLHLVESNEPPIKIVDNK